MEMAGTFKEEPLLAKRIDESENGTLLRKDEINSLLKMDKNIKNDLIALYGGLDIRIWKFDTIKDKNKMKESFFKIYGKNEDEFNSFLNEINNSKGCLYYYDNKEIILFLNINPFLKYTYKDIYHELTHFFQQFEKDHSPNEKIEINLNKIQDKLKEKNINIDNSRILYILRVKEFIPHINDLCYDLKELKNKEYKDLKNDEYLKFLFDLTKSNDPLHEKFAIKLLSFSDDMLPLITFLISFYFNIEYKRIKNIIIDDFK